MQIMQLDLSCCLFIYIRVPYEIDLTLFAWFVKWNIQIIVVVNHNIIYTMKKIDNNSLQCARILHI